jgi:hypothetical protein
MPELIKLFPNTVKVMATSAFVCMRFLIQVMILFALLVVKVKLCWAIA